MIYEPLFKLERTGVQIHYYTDKGKYNPVHWHSAIELIYVLNGSGAIMIDGKDHQVVAGDYVVIDSNQMHEVKCVNASMMIMIHFSRNSMKNFVADLDSYRFICTREGLHKEQIESYLGVCELLKGLPPMYVIQPPGFRLKSQAIAMSVFFELLNHFANKEEIIPTVDKNSVLERLAEITEYIEIHHKETISLEEISSHFYLSREYFSRFFRQSMGVTFSKYVNQVRLMHIYTDICNTRKGIMEISEEHGFTNYKLFKKMFRETYGCLPREARKQ